MHTLSVSMNMNSLTEMVISVFAGSYLRYKRASLISSDLAVLVKFFLLKNALIVPLKAVDFCA